MSSVTGVKKATARLSPQERWELFVWLRESEEVRSRQREELARDIAVGVEQADRGEIAPLNIPSIRAKIHKRVKVASQS